MIWKAESCAFLLGLLAACNGEKIVLGGDSDAGCVPGTYLGTFDCNASDSAVQLGGVVGSGSVSLTLAGDRGGPILPIAPGARITGSQQGSTFGADLSGALDCTTSYLDGSVDNATFQSQAFTTMLSGKGPLSADYDASFSSPPALDGILSWPGIQGIQGALQGQTVQTCRWTATLQ